MGKCLGTLVERIIVIEAFGRSGEVKKKRAEEKEEKGEKEEKREKEREKKEEK